MIISGVSRVGFIIIYAAADFAMILSLASLSPPPTLGQFERNNFFVNVRIKYFLERARCLSFVVLLTV